MIFIYFVVFIDSERAKRRAGLVHMYIFYKLKSKIGESQDEGPDVSEQIAVCLRERPGKSECETCCKIEPSKSRQKTLMCFSDRGQSKNVSSIQKKTLAG